MQPCPNFLIYKCSSEYNDTSSKTKLLFYEDNKKVFQKIEILHGCIQDLKISVSSSLSDLEKLSSLELKLKEFQSELTLWLDTEIIRGYDEMTSMQPANEGYMTNPNSHHPTSFNASDSTIFENFLNLTSHPKLQSSFWTDILSFRNQEKEAHDSELKI